jgi:transposase
MEELERTKGTLVLEDESGLSLVPLVGRTWAPRGETPLLRCSMGKRERLATIGGITPEGRIYFRIHEESIKSPQVVEYLTQLLRQIRGHIVLVWDNGSTHTTHLTQAFLESVKERLTVFYLPAYFPKLNPTEYLWTYIKWAKMKDYCPMGIPELKGKLNGCVRSLRRNPRKVRSFFDVRPMPMGEDAELKVEKLLSDPDAANRNWRRE